MKFSPDQTVGKFLQAFQEEQVLPREFGHSPLIQIQEWSEFPPQVPLFESIFVFENYPVDSSLKEQKGSITFSDVHVEEQTNFPLTVAASSSDQISLKITYDQERFNELTIQRLLRNMETLLEGIVAAPDQRIGTLPILTEEEQEQILVAWNQTRKAGSTDTCAHTLFETQAEAKPGAAAVVHGGESLSYGDLNSRANQLGRYLQSNGSRTRKPGGGMPGKIGGGGGSHPGDPESGRGIPAAGP